MNRISYIDKTMRKKQIKNKLLSKLFLYLLVIITCIFVPACRSMNSRNKLDSAEELLRQDKYEEAIKLYKDHMNSRLTLKNRPEWENPYFYYLLIGDIELRRSNVSAAVENYKIAQVNGIHESLISDRFRYIASWYEEKGKLEEAINILKENRALDPLLFDAMLDRLARDLIKKQDEDKIKNTPANN